jgi:hypothetical protein
MKKCFRGDGEEVKAESFQSKSTRGAVTKK